MRPFSQLLDALVYTRSRNGKLALIAAYLRSAPDPDRGWALAALTGNLDLKAVKSSAIGEMIRARVDPVLYEMSRDYVGDLAETVALLWPTPPGEPPDLDDGTLTLAAVVDRLHATSRAAAPDALAQMMDHLDASGRFALLKLATGGLRVGISARLAKTGFAQAFGLDVDDVEQVWHALSPPYTALFDWAEGRAPRPDPAGTPFFRPFMLAHPLEETVVDLADYVAEWKW
ncbi:MAG: ATP-dependent DNA ligase, partial [Alphaproteobacteria bacterium]|nr:ATP-dependent DNA ligase [Alphaproteobacteria bacterium]